VPTCDDPRRKSLPFDPYDEKPRKPQSYFSVGTGGWLPTVIFVNAVLAAALAAVLFGSTRWDLNGAVGAGVGVVTWLVLVGKANRQYKKLEDEWLERAA